MWPCCSLPPCLLPPCSTLALLSAPPALTALALPLGLFQGGTAQPQAQASHQAPWSHLHASSPSSKYQSSPRAVPWPHLPSQSRPRAPGCRLRRLWHKLPPLVLALALDLDLDLVQAWALRTQLPSCTLQPPPALHAPLPRHLHIWAACRGRPCCPVCQSPRRQLRAWVFLLAAWGTAASSTQHLWWQGGPRVPPAAHMVPRSGAARDQHMRAAARSRAQPCLRSRMTACGQACAHRAQHQVRSEDITLAPSCTPGLRRQDGAPPCSRTHGAGPQPCYPCSYPYVCVPAPFLPALDRERLHGPEAQNR